MSENFEGQPLETPEASEGIQSNETQNLDDATFEPGAYIEQTGDVRQAENIQTSFETLISASAAEKVPESTVPDAIKKADASQVVQESREATPGSQDRVVAVISKALMDPEFREKLLNEPDVALEGFNLTREESHALGSIKKDAFEVFATEVEERVAKSSINLKKNEHVPYVPTTHFDDVMLDKLLRKKNFKDE